VAATGDPSHLRAGGTSLANLAEFILLLLDARGATSVVEIGAFRGELTRDLLGWAQGRGAQVAAVDPTPTDELLELSRQHRELELIRATSFAALDEMPIPEAVIIDGDHNYYTVSGELERIHREADAVASPLVMLHDVGWPLGRRDSYHAPDQIPAEYRQSVFPHGGLSSEMSLAADRPFAYTAEREGGPRNGGLTAIEDFMAEHGSLRLAVVPAFFGLGVLWRVDAPWAGDVAEAIGPFDRHPVLERMEADRVAHLVAEQMYERRLHDLQEQTES
jgi:hypothetical protein